MSEYQQLLNNLNNLHSSEWIALYFDTLKKLLTELGLKHDDPRLSLTLTKNGYMSVNIGSRNVLPPLGPGGVLCIVPSSFDEKKVNGEVKFLFKKKGIVDAKWVMAPVPKGVIITPLLYNACKEACMEIIKYSNKSNFRKFHVPLLYDFTMEPSVRKEIMDELEMKEN